MQENTFMKSALAAWSVLSAGVAYFIAETVLHYKREAWFRKTQRLRHPIPPS